MHYFFTKEDYECLLQEIARICDRIKDAGKEMGQSCKEGAETFHDNFAYEEGERQQIMWSNRLRELIKIKNMARVITSIDSSDIVSLGRTITIHDTNTGHRKRLKIGSYMVFCKSDKHTPTISYAAPLAKLLIGASAGDTREGVISGKKHIYLIEKIE